MMDSTLKKLAAVVEAEIRNYEQLRDLERRKREDLVAGRLLGLEGLVSEEESLVNTLRSLEERRRALQQGWAASRNLRGTPTLGDIAGMLEGEEGEALMAQRRRLKAVSLELHRENEGNETLVRQSLEHLGGLLHIMTGHRQNLAYEAGGAASGLGHRLILDKSA